MLRIGLTGGVASGKSSVAAMFTDLGAAIVDTDVIAREVVLPGTAGLEEIRQLFGDGVIAADGNLDRAAMRQIVFADEDKRLALERILHPRIRVETLRQAELADGPYVIVVVPLLVESPLCDSMDRILVVDCDPDTQLERLRSRDNDDETQARRMIAAQASREQRLAIADDIIDNSGPLGATRERVNDLHAYYLQLAERVC